jgi:hypothetical protein
MSTPKTQDIDLAKLVKNAKVGDRKALDSIYEKFKPFLIKYRALLKTGTVNLSTRDLRRFLCLYIDSEHLRSAIKSSRLNKKTSDLLAAKVADIRAQYDGMDPEDIDSIIDFTFFQCLLDIYDPKGKVKSKTREEGLVYDDMTVAQKRKWDKLHPEVGFEGFLANYFFYQLKKNLEAETKGVIPGIGWCQTFTTEDIIEEVLDSDDETEEHDEWDDLDTIIGSEIAIDHDWVDGMSANYPFSELSVQDRWLLKMRYEDDLFSCKIARKVGVSASVIRGRLKDIEMRLRELMKD